MKITIEPTEHVDDYITVAVSSPIDDDGVYAAIELFRAALLAWGFTVETLTKAFPPNND